MTSTHLPLIELPHIAQMLNSCHKVDKRGNRTSALEVLPHPTGTTTTTAYDDDGIVTNGTWSDVSSYKQSSTATDTLAFMFLGDENVELTMGEGSDHGRYDVYINRAFWRSFDGYAASSGDKVIAINLEADGAHHLEIRVRSDRNKNSSGNLVRFKQLVVDGAYDIQTVDYAYDKLSRLLSADYYQGINTDGSAFRKHAYGFDVAGNRTSASVALNGASPTVTNYSYNTANQLTGDGTDTFTYDANGNLWKTNTTITHTWDRANRMLTAPGSTSYAYDGLGNRIHQTVSSVVTDYLLDLQPGLTKVIAATTGANTSRYIHDPRGIFAHEDNAGVWDYTLADGLGSVRAEVTTAGAISANQHYGPFGQPFATNGSFDAGFGFTGEQTDDNDLLYLRARYYDPSMGIFPSLDPFEGISNRPMSLNGYSWVEGNPVMRTDPSGMLFWAFRSGTRRESINTQRAYDRSANYAHPWIEYWMEQAYGSEGFWHVHAEFAGGAGRKIDIIAFQDIALQGVLPPSPVWLPPLALQCQLRQNELKCL